MRHLIYALLWAVLVLVAAVVWYAVSAGRNPPSPWEQPPQCEEKVPYLVNGKRYELKFLSDCDPKTEYM